MDADVLGQLRACADDPDVDEIRLASLVARVLDPALDAEGIEADLQRLARRCPTTLAPWRFLAGQGFEGNFRDYSALDNSNLARVLETRRGIPITLGVILIRVARLAGRRASGINFPGHFLVEVDDELVDPFVMETRNARDLAERLPASARGLPAARLFAPASPVAVGLRMLNNIKLIYAAQAAWHRTLDVLDAELALAPDQPGFHLEQGDVWWRLGAVAPARASWERALAVTAKTGGRLEEVTRAVRQRLDEAGDAGDVVH